jgi:hypothetical protein
LAEILRRIRWQERLVFIALHERKTAGNEMPPTKRAPG